MTNQGTVLVADDCALLQDLIREIVADDGVDVVAAFDGEEAARLAREHRPDAIVLDLLMPRMDGLSCLIHLRNDPATKEIPVLMVSGAPSPKARRLATSFGACGFLEKPVAVDELAGHVRSLLARGGVETL
jgi:CheY-like chemotaxis protein